MSQRPHDAPAGPNADVRNLRVEVLRKAWFTLRRATFEIRQPDGTWLETQREAYDRGNGAVALLHNTELDTILLVRQYRLPVHLNEHPDGMLLELPAGLIDPDEDAEQALRRELAEEVGHEVGPLRRVFQLYMSPGSVTEHVTHFVASYDAQTRMSEGGGEGANEQIEVVEVTLDEAAGMIADGRICDAKTVVLVQWALLRRAAGLPVGAADGP